MIDEGKRVMCHATSSSMCHTMSSQMMPHDDVSCHVIVYMSYHVNKELVDRRWSRFGVFSKKVVVKGIIHWSMTDNRASRKFTSNFG
jgi:hypothetical protein